MTNKSKFLMGKEDYITNSLSLGIAVRYLCELTGQPLNYWVSRISKEANAQCDKLSPEQIEQTIKDYLKNKSSGNISSNSLHFKSVNPSNRPAIL
ncbi:MAG: hypothetical protein RMX68_005795 [Aulosira sp. ZfuVER01]|nr:hypothetical protein [Aulosira sp. ZfuVER01]MDZ8000487.1 hypothetical protein [Aulosira sp. DedVER01a]MDZ8052959.1 hypothetical protein [Aulosira sp. ZfuCHP01]